MGMAAAGLSEAQDMRHTRTLLLSVAAACLLPFATPAIAELGHPSGCLSCAPVEVPGPAPDCDQQGAPVIGPLPGMGGPPAATAPKPETGRHRHTRANRRHVKVWNATYPREQCHAPIGSGRRPARRRRPIGGSAARTPLARDWSGFDRGRVKTRRAILYSRAERESSLRFVLVCKAIGLEIWDSPGPPQSFHTPSTLSCPLRSAP
jgi:hypothetical protein